MSNEWDAEAGDYVERVIERDLLIFLFGKTIYDIDVREYACLRVAIDAVMEGYVVVKGEQVQSRVTVEYMHVRTAQDRFNFNAYTSALESGCIGVHQECSQ